MHKANELFWEYVNKTYNIFLEDEIIEFGSYNINGSIKDILNTKAKEYVGVDWRPGPNVDLVSLAHEVKFDKKFKAVVSASMLEHDPHWELSIKNMATLMKENGILVLTWGSALNPKHCLKEAPDRKFHCLKVEKVTNLLKELGLYTTLLIYEGNLTKIIDISFKNLGTRKNGMGEIGLVAFNTQHEIIHIDEILPEDRVETIKKII